MVNHISPPTGGISLETQYEIEALDFIQLLEAI